MPKDNFREVLTFRLGSQEYAVDIILVREIRGWSETTTMPHTAAHVHGVINLRGTVLPVLDLAARLGLPGIKPTERNVIIVVQNSNGYSGLLVDAVADIISLNEDDLQHNNISVCEDGESAVSSLCLFEDRLIRLIQLDAVCEYPEQVA